MGSDQSLDGGQTNFTCISTCCSTKNKVGVINKRKGLNQSDTEAEINDNPIKNQEIIGFKTYEAIKNDFEIFDDEILSEGEFGNLRMCRHKITKIYG